MVSITLTGKARDADGLTATKSLAVRVASTAVSAEPNASTTGAKGTLTNYTGPFTVTTAGTVIKDKIINRSMRVTGANARFENCRLTSNESWGIDADGATGLVVSRCTILQPSGGNSCILTGANATVEYCDLSGPDNGLQVQNGTQLIQFNYIHDLHPGAVGDAHVDGIQFGGPNDGVIIRGNSVRSWDTSCVFFKTEWNGDIQNVLVDGNWLRNQAGKNTSSTVYVYSVKGTCRNITFSNNFMEMGNAFCLYNTAGDRTQTTWTNNKDIATGAVIPKP